MHRLIFFLAVVASNLGLFKFQTPFCDLDAIVGDPAQLPLPSIDIDGRYSVLIEKNYGGKTSEYREFYDGVDNVGVIRSIEDGDVYSYYYYYSKNEILVVRDYECASFPLDKLSPQVTVGFQVVVINDKEHILSPLNAIISNPGFQVKYIGKNETERTIAVDQWISCLKSKDKIKSIKMKISYSDPEEFTPPSYWEDPSTTNTVPIEFIIETKDESNGQITTEVYSLTNFRPFVPHAEEFYLTKSGVYCIDRKNTLSFPTLTESFVYMTQIAPGIDGKTGYDGIVESLYVEFNSEFELYGRAYEVANSSIFELRDYHTGLVYEISAKTGECLISDLVPPDYYIQQNQNLDIKDPNQFFNLTGFDYQYVGKKRLEGLIDCDVWVGKSQIVGVPVTLEWYFLSEFWDNPNRKSLNAPMLLKAFLPENMTYLYSIFGFRPTGFNLVDYDIASCHPNTARKFFIFRLNEDLIPVVMSNVKGFKEAVVKLIQEKAKISVLRISQIEVTYDFEGVYVFFTLYDRVKAYGPLATGVYQDDTPLKDAVKLLNKAFLNDEIQIRYYSYTDETDLVIPIVVDSLREIGNYQEGFFTIYKEKATSGFSAGAVIGVVIVVTILGAIGGYFLIMLHKAKRIHLPIVDAVLKS